MNTSSNTVSVLLGTGTGSFGAKTDFTTGSNPTSVAIGDVSGDGYADLAVVNNYSNTVSVLLGTGTGSFGAKTDFATGSFPYSVAIGDVNGDGHSDLAVANNNSSTLSVLLGTGTGSFGAKTDFATGSFPISVAIGDVNGDGRPDLVVANNGASTVSLLSEYLPARVTVASSPTLPVYGVPYAFTASVAATSAALGTPSGTVSFFDGGTLLGTATLSAGAATLTVSNAQYVSHTITAVYSGDTRFTGAIGTLAMPTSLAAHIVGVRDVPNDQGGKVRIQWDASALDRLPSNPITQYWIWRQVPSMLAANRLASGAYRLGSAAEAASDRTVMRTTALGGQYYYWEYVASQPASAFPGYSVMVATPFDSTKTSNLRTWFMVQAIEPSDGAYWASNPDSGYSVDNLAPVSPAPFTAARIAAVTHLSWGPDAADADFASFHLYRGATSGFVPAAGNLIATLTDTSYADAAPAGQYYKLAAVDVHGNESAYALVTPAGTTGVDDSRVPTELALAAPSPNPAQLRTSLAFALPRAGAVTLAVYDVSGRLVRTLAAGTLAAGLHDAAWDLRDAAGHAVAGGVYFARLEAPGGTRVRRFAVVN